MNQGVNPSFEFFIDVEANGTLTNIGNTWTDSTHFVGDWTIADVNVTQALIDINVTAAEDVLENLEFKPLAKAQ